MVILKMIRMNEIFKRFKQFNVKRKESIFFKKIFLLLRFLFHEEVFFRDNSWNKLGAHMCIRSVIIINNVY